MKYFTFVHDERKLRHLLQHNGYTAALAWAKAHDTEGLLRTLVDK